MNLESAAAELATDRGLRWLWVGVWVLFALSMGACMAKGADRPADPALQDSSRVPGFAEVAFRVEPPSGAATRHCALLADTEQTRSLGLMNRNDLAGYDGMVFSFAADGQAAFHMQNTLIPLSIAFFDSGGHFVSALDMVPCISTGDCPHYNATASYRTAIEVAKGGLPGLGIGPGSVMHVGGSCT
ncbi:MAG: uncharacterized protein QOJ09_615 [Actinomycetota bacterium]|jgi:uncharacterized membrane protein (UPF0127 family)|nr:uncharacterized protein [Actinomycetota bacterium]